VVIKHERILDEKNCFLLLIENCFLLLFSSFKTKSLIGAIVFLGHAIGFGFRTNHDRRNYICDSVVGASKPRVRTKDIPGIYFSATGMK